MDAETLEEKMTRLAAGDREVFPAVFRALEMPLRRFCARLLGDGADADDATQEALTKLFTRASDYEPPRQVLPWAITIAAWECRTIRRRRGRRREGPFVKESESAGRSPEEELETKELLAAAEEAFSHLTNADRATLLEALAKDEGATSSPAERKRKQRAIERLRHLVRKLYDLG